MTCCPAVTAPINLLVLSENYSSTETRSRAQVNIWWVTLCRSTRRVLVHIAFSRVSRITFWAGGSSTRQRAHLVWRMYHFATYLLPCHISVVELLSSILFLSKYHDGEQGCCICGSPTFANVRMHGLANYWKKRKCKIKCMYVFGYKRSQNILMINYGSLRVKTTS